MKRKTKEIKIGNVENVILVKQPMTRTLDSWVDIQTTTEKAWNALVDLKSWKDWNSFIPSVKGTLATGNKVSIVVKSPGLKEMEFHPIVFEIVEGMKLSWGGGSLLFGYKGIHEFIIEPVDKNLVRFRQVEKFQGPIVWFMKRMILKTAIGYANMNEEFKKMLEE